MNRAVYRNIFPSYRIKYHNEVDEGGKGNKRGETNEKQTQGGKMEGRMEICSTRRKDKMEREEG